MNDLMDDNEKSGGRAQKQTVDTNTPVLDNFSRDLNKLAQEGKLDPIIGREAEILRIAQILSRRKKNNPIIIGEPGCVLEDTIIDVEKYSDVSTHNIEIM
jgi:ATP-dependent Clp protease ATP-binding subunit ClpA